MRQRAVKSDVDDGDAGEGGRDGITHSARRALKKVDVYPKMHGEFKVQTEFGATSTFLSTGAAPAADSRDSPVRLLL